MWCSLAAPNYHALNHTYLVLAIYAFVSSLFNSHRHNCFTFWNCTCSALKVWILTNHTQLNLPVVYRVCNMYCADVLSTRYWTRQSVYYFIDRTLYSFCYSTTDISDMLFFLTIDLKISDYNLQGLLTKQNPLKEYRIEEICLKLLPSSCQSI